ncbi:MAG: EscU/YscU/HrcU family type III secretion system export apparatus switch protein [Lachnospiraceae bacterium]|nr:EscU/YscU/HrcU family type III secretion system export apparatus switch protein [Lachnospiraceae bacterium]
MPGEDSQNFNIEEDKNLTAVALAYDPGDEAPRILATGKGHIAQKIIEEAKAADVPFYKDSKLAETLSALEIGDAIPPDLYEVVAQILVFVDGMDKVKQKLDEAGYKPR